MTTPRCFSDKNRTPTCLPGKPGTKEKFILEHFKHDVISPFDQTVYRRTRRVKLRSYQGKTSEEMTTKPETQAQPRSWSKYVSTPKIKEPKIHKCWIGTDSTPWIGTNLGNLHQFFSSSAFLLYLMLQAYSKCYFVDPTQFPINLYKHYNQQLYSSIYSSFGPTNKLIIV